MYDINNTDLKPQSSVFILSLHVFTSSLVSCLELQHKPIEHPLSSTVSVISLQSPHVCTSHDAPLYMYFS